MTNYRKIKRVFLQALWAGRTVCAPRGWELIAAGSDWLRGPKAAHGTQSEAGAQEIHKRMRCKHHWSSPLRHPQPSAHGGSQGRYNHMREYKKCKVNLSCTFKLAC